MTETNEQFEQRLGIDYDSNRCEARWQKHYNRAIVDAKQYCAEIWEYRAGNFKSGVDCKHYDESSWEESE